MRHAEGRLDFVSRLCYYSPISKRKEVKMTNYIGKLTDHDLYMANKIAERTGSTSAKVLKDFNDFLGQVYAQQEQDEECD